MGAGILVVFIWMRCNYNTYIICLTALDQEFVQRMKNENVDIKQLGLVGRTKEKIL